MICGELPPRLEFIMKKVSQHALPWQELHSPGGKFHVFRRHLSRALGGVKDTGPAGGGHPFDVELTRIPPGATNWPFHSHAAQWELFIVLEGQGEVRLDSGTVAITAGDTFVHPPGEAHNITNTGGTDLALYIVADNPAADAIHYPDSNKWFLKPAGKSFRMDEVDYYDAEE
jgi:uncharacterized cupin superfamily protein